MITIITSVRLQEITRSSGQDSTQVFHPNCRPNQWRSNHTRLQNPLLSPVRSQSKAVTAQATYIKRWRPNAAATGLSSWGCKQSRRMESSHGPSRPDRKTIEKNRRIQMKALYSKLDSLLPNSPTSRERVTQTLPDRLDEAMNYINGLRGRVESMKERKRQLMEPEGTSRAMGSEVGGGMRLPLIEVQALGSGLRVVLISSPGDRLIFYEALRALEEEGGAILNASFSVVGDKAFHTIHSMVADPRGGSQAGKVLERLRKACSPCY